MSFLHHILDMVYPRYCAGCEGLLEQDEILCLQCFQELPYTHFLNREDNPVREIFYGRIKIEYAGSALFYTKNSPVQNLMFDLKYHNNKNAGKLMGVILSNELQKTEWIKDIDVLIPMPLHPKKKQSRGYNQAAVIAGEMSKILDIPMDETSVVKSTHTETQTHKTREARWQSMQNVFRINNENALYGKHILLVDDVLTTGATLEVCGSEILKILGTKLSIITAAYAL